MAKRMKLISEIDLKRLSQLQNPTDVNYIEGNLDKKKHDAQNLLKTHSIPDDIKLSMYSNLMNSISLEVKRVLDTPILVKNIEEHANCANSFEKTLESDNTNTTMNSSSSSSSRSTQSKEFTIRPWEDKLLSKLPEKCRRKASDIMLILKEHADLVKWNRVGEVSFLKGNFEDGSSIVDLLSYVVHELKWTVAPKGTNRFLLCLKRLNVPLSLMRNDIRKRLGKSMDYISDVKSAGDSPDYFVQMKQRLKNWECIKGNDSSIFSPLGTSTP